MKPEDIPVFPLDTPVCRPLEIMPAETDNGAVLIVRDPMGVIDPLVIAYNPVLLAFMQMADGNTSCAEMAESLQKATGQTFTSENMKSVAEQLDDVLLLQSEKFVDAYREKLNEFVALPVRPATVLKVDPDNRLESMKEIGSEFRRHNAGPKAPPAEIQLPRNSVAAVLSPHIDYMRGGHAYAWAYRALREHGIPAKTFIILGTSHRPMSHKFVATRKDFETPFGTLQSDIDILEELAAEFGGPLFEDEFAHAQEHSIELQTTYLRKTFEDSKDIRIVPVLVGSFDTFFENGSSPADDDEIQRFCNALRTLLDRHGDRIALIGGVDLSHTGQQFGDEEINDKAREHEVEKRDRAAIAAMESGDADAFFNLFREDGNACNVCSIAPIYCIMQAMKGRASARLLTYDQANSEDKTCMVTFCSMAFLNNT